jgi:hypothetical protein
MKTYAESKGNKPYDWNDFLDRAIRGEVKGWESVKSSDLSERWVTCACGNLCDRIPRREDGAPEDFLLRKLGCEFANDITWSRWEIAKERLIDIELRSSEILREMDKRNEL